MKPGGVFLINCQWSFEELEHHLNAEAKRYIAKNNVQLYTINAIDLAIQVGMGKRTNTILQSAFFSLAKVMPEAEAIGYMKDAAEHSYLKKGRDVVEKNWSAIDAGATAYVKIDVPSAWAEAVDAPAEDSSGWRSRNRQAGQECAHSCGQDGRRQPARVRFRGLCGRPVCPGRFRL